jgi:hypothetical protein
MVLAVAFHVNGFGSWFRCSIHSSIAAQRALAADQQAIIERVEAFVHQLQVDLARCDYLMILHGHKFGGAGQGWTFREPRAHFGNY